MKTLNKVIMVMAALVMAFTFESCGGITAKAIAESMNADCPQDLGDGMELTSVTAESNNVVYLYSFELEEGVDVADVITDDAKAGVVEGLKAQAKTDSDLKELINLCTTAGTNIVYRYKNTATGNQKDIVVSSNDLK